MGDRSESRTTETAETVETADDADAESESTPDGGSDHLDDIEDGAGCTEIWEHLSESRQAERDA